jgi:RecA/RadA recombinase
MANGLLSKMRKTIEKKFDDVVVDLEEPKIWANSGNYVLNHILSGQFGRGYPAGRITQIFGESGSGKSYLVSKAIVEAQADGYMVVILDSEQAMSHDYLEKIGVDTNADKLLTVQCYTVEQAQDLMIELLNDIKEARNNNGDEIKLMLIVDSLGLLSSNKAAEDAEKGGSTAADMGTKAKALVRMFNAVTQKIGLTETVCIMTNHGAKEVGVMFPQIKPVGGRSVEYVPSISLRVTKSKLKQSELDELAFLYGGEMPKNLDALGIVSKLELYKSRFTRPFRKVKLMIPYDMGLHKYAGLFEYLYTNDVIQQSRRGYYNYKNSPFDKDFTRKKFIEDGYAEKIVNDLINREKSGEIFDFIMKSENEEKEIEENEKEK